jgi:hypothetical protein
MEIINNITSLLGDDLKRTLKLLQETDPGKVKMIYIDPPYNTGNDFIYGDDFTAEKEAHQRGAGERDGEGDRAAPKLKRFLCDVKEGTTWTTLWDFAPLNTEGSNGRVWYIPNGTEIRPSIGGQECPPSLLPARRTALFSGESA